MSWIVGGGTDFPFLFIYFFCLDGLQFLKHACLAFEEGIANQRGLRLLWSNSKGFPHLTTTALFTAMPKYKTSMTSNISPKLFTIHTCHQTVTLQCFQLRLDLLLPKKNTFRSLHGQHLFQSLHDRTVNTDCLVKSKGNRKTKVRL